MSFAKADARVLMQPFKLHCCHIKSSNEIETPIFVFYVFGISKGNDYRFY